MNRISWHEIRMQQALILAKRSKDPNTQVGCIITDSEHHIISEGYNGMIAGVDESQIPWTNDKGVPSYDTKYPFVIHAEANALLRTNRKYLDDCILYCTLFPCSDCTKLLLTKRIKKVIYYSDKYNRTDDNIASKKHMTLCGCVYVSYDSLMR